MDFRPLGNTGLVVSALSLGTVSLGVDYGIAAPGEFGPPDERDALALIGAALDRGITLIDTAPAYGDSERIVGVAAGRDPRAIIATKITLPSAAEAPGVSDLSSIVAASLESSRRAIRRDAIDIVQIHNATRETIENRAITDALLDAKQRGMVRVIGASVYGEDAALAVITSGEYGVVQIALNALDQRGRHSVLPTAAAAGVGVVVRSAFLKGALTPKAQWLPETLAPVRAAAARARDLIAGGSWDALPEAAMRFCLSVPYVASVLTGARTRAELESALAAEAVGPLDAATFAASARLAVSDDALLDPSRWPIP
ncbi:MAG TPA: aldo/keto reductase [Vicinamibacterales bacterium]|nr:aldo/keto reductase [Vicinamibacterales bacterium]